MTHQQNAPNHGEKLWTWLKEATMFQLLIVLLKFGEIVMERKRSIRLLILEILSAILLATVLICFALIPAAEPIKSPQKHLARAGPIIDFLLVCKVQFLALMLSIIQSTTE
jgi:hypothetical protein